MELFSIRIQRTFQLVSTLHTYADMHKYINVNIQIYIQMEIQI